MHKLFGVDLAVSQVVVVALGFAPVVDGLHADVYVQRQGMAQKLRLLIDFALIRLNLDDYEPLLSRFQAYRVLVLFIRRLHPVNFFRLKDQVLLELIHLLVVLEQKTHVPEVRFQDQLLKLERILHLVFLHFVIVFHKFGLNDLFDEVVCLMDQRLICELKLDRAVGCHRELPAVILGQRLNPFDLSEEDVGARTLR